MVPPGGRESSAVACLTRAHESGRVVATILQSQRNARCQTHGGGPAAPLAPPPRLAASTDGRPERYVAREAEGAERERLWKLATKLYSGYEDYQARATNRRIPVIGGCPARC